MQLSRALLGRIHMRMELKPYVIPNVYAGLYNLVDLENVVVLNAEG